MGGHAEQKTKAYFRGYVRFGSQTHSFVSTLLIVPTCLVVNY